MKVFISGSKAIGQLDMKTKNYLQQVKDKGYHVLVGDCWGVDALVQRFFIDYPHVTVYHSGTPRNNLGQWKTVCIYGQRWEKDVQMAEDADCGIAIWDGKSRGTGNNIERLKQNSKTVLVINL